MWCNVKLTEYRRGQPGASQRLSVFSKFIRVAPRPENPPVIPSTTKGGNQRDYRAEAIARARRTISHLLRSADPNRLKFLTLTWANQVRDARAAKQMIDDFLVRLRGLCPDLAWVGSLEHHKSGALHAHLIVAMDYIPQADLAALWGYGFVWVTALADTDVACRYLTKYLLKDAIDLPESYFRSRNWPDTSEVIWYAVRSVEAFVAALEANLGPAYVADLAGQQRCWIFTAEGDAITRYLFGGGG